MDMGLVEKSKLNALTILFVTLFLLSCVSNSTEPDDSISLKALGRATSEGNQWKQLVQLPLKIDKINFRLTDISCSKKGFIYASTSGGGVFEINPNDNSYRQVTDGLIADNAIGIGEAYFVSTVLCVDNRIVCSSSDLRTKGGYYYSNDTGTFNTSMLLGKYTFGVSLNQSPNGQLFASSYQQVFRSNDFGRSWIDETFKADEGFGYFYSFAFDSRNGIYATGYKGIYFSDSKEISFKRIGLENETTYGVDINSNGWIFVSTMSGNYYYSKDEGKSWNSIITVPSGIIGRCLYINTNNTIFLGSSNGIYRSKDNGVSWEFLGLADEIILKITSDNKGNLLVGTFGSRVYLGTN